MSIVVVPTPVGVNLPRSEFKGSEEGVVPTPVGVNRASATSRTSQ